MITTWSRNKAKGNCPLHETASRNSRHYRMLTSLFWRPLFTLSYLSGLWDLPRCQALFVCCCFFLSLKLILTKVYELKMGLIDTGQEAGLSYVQCKSHQQLISTKLFEAGNIPSIKHIRYNTTVFPICHTDIFSHFSEISLFIRKCLFFSFQHFKTLKSETRKCFPLLQ